jgi:predicted Zn-dependent protease
VSVTSRPAAARGASVPIIAITDVWTDPADTSLLWLSDGLTQMIAADIGHVSAAGIVAPAVVRELSTGAKRTDSLQATESVSRAQRLGAGWAASALVTRQHASYMLVITLRDAINRTVDRRYELRGPDIVALADEASAKLLALLDVDPNGPHLSEIETSNTGAYRHFIEGERYHAEGNLAGETRELDAAIAADSGFTSAIAARLPSSDAATYQRLKILFDRARPRMSYWDWISEATDQAFLNGEPKRAEELARQRLARYPRDPRSMRMLAEIYVLHGAYARAESTYLKLVALDSAAGDNSVPCWTCEAYAGLVASRQLRGDQVGVLAAARRWTELRPSYAAAWLTLADALSLSGDFPTAETAAARYRELSGNKDGFDSFTGRILLTERRLDDAESYARKFLASDQSGEASDLLECVLRERGQYRLAVKQFELRGRGPGTGLTLVYAHTLAVAGQVEAARRAFEISGWHPTHAADLTHNYGIFARGFSWTHALEADALRDRADTLLLRALADSIERIGAASYYARDWTAFDHVRGLIDVRAGRYAEAKAHFEAALSLVPGWTRTNIELAKVDLVLGQPDSAIAVLHQALQQSSDAMGRYAPRTEIDYQMSVAFAKAGKLDSARAYSAYVRSAWVRADPQFRKRLTALP